MLDRYALLLCQLILIPLPLSAETPSVTLLATDGKSYQVLGMPNWNGHHLAVMDDQTEQELPWESVVRIGHLPEMLPATVFVLRDGTRWSLQAGETWHLDPTSLTLRRGDQAVCEVPRSLLRVIAVRTCVDPIARDQQFQIWEQPTKLDRVWFSEADSWDGELVLGSSDEIVVTRSGRETRFPTREIGAIHFRTAAASSAAVTQAAESPATPTPRTLVGLTDGSTFWVKQLTARGQDLELTMADEPWTISVAWHGEGGARRVGFVQPHSGHITYLSDLQPPGYRHIPYLTQQLPVQWNHHVAGGTLRVGTRCYVRGVGMPSAARLAFPIPAGMTHFAAEIGIDLAAGGQGSVIFRVLLLRPSGTWTEAFASPILRGGEEPVAVHLPLEDAQAIALVTDFSDRGDVLDLANWCDARLERR